APREDRAARPPADAEPGRTNGERPGSLEPVGEEDAEEGHEPEAVELWVVEPPGRSGRAKRAHRHPRLIVTGAGAEKTSGGGVVGPAARSAGVSGAVTATSG